MLTEFKTDIIFADNDVIGNGKIEIKSTGDNLGSDTSHIPTFRQNILGFAYIFR